MICQQRVLTRRDYGKLRENPGEVGAKAENLTDRKSDYSSLEASRTAAVALTEEQHSTKTVGQTVDRKKLL